jgi:hypothetical protein
MAPRLKVFTWSDGFHAFTVAAPSRPKALAAWGIERDIFAGGLAREIRDGPDHDAALARPGEVIERGLAVDVGEVAPRRKSKASAPPKRTGPSKAALARVRDLDAELKALDREQAAARRELEAEAARIARALDSLAERQGKARDRLRERLGKARAALEGG